jgi:hypothetical protein
MYFLFNFIMGGLLSILIMQMEVSDIFTHYLRLKLKNIKLLNLNAIN